MENKFKVALYKKKLEDTLASSRLLSFFENYPNPLRLASTRYDEVFRLLTEGKTLAIGNLELTNTSLYQALTDAERKDLQNSRTNIYTGDDYKVQNKKLNALINEGETYLTFGLLDYFVDNHMKIISAPLVLMRINIDYLKDQDRYQVSSLNHEVYLNDALITYFEQNFHIDISYPINNNFSLIEYLTYIASKVRNAHFSVNNGCFFASLNLTPYYFYQDLSIHQDEIASLDIIKTISYFNAEFFHLNKAKGTRLDDNYLSLLDLDNEEYKILKRVSLRENIFIRTNHEENKEHLFKNIVYDYLLNNKNILITYKTDEDYKKIKNYLNNADLNNYYLDLSVQTNKLRIINQLSSLDKTLVDENSLDSSKINEIVDKYYQIKNNYNKVVNAMRMNNDTLDSSINKLISNYYSLSSYELLDIEIPNVENITEEKVNEYLTSIVSFAKVVEKLRCNYQDHPFFGLSRFDLKQEDYDLFREKAISFESEFAPEKKAFLTIHNNYHLPIPKNIKEMKAILNIISNVKNSYDFPRELLNKDSFNNISTLIEQQNKLREQLELTKLKITSVYQNKVLSINYEEFNKDLETLPLNKNIIKKYRQYLAHNVKVDEDVLLTLNNSLKEYYNLKNETDNFSNQYPYFDKYLVNNTYNMLSLKPVLESVSAYINSLIYLQKNHPDLNNDILDYFDNDKTTTLSLDQRQTQLAYNHFLRALNFFKPYFDENLIDLFSLDLDVLENKIKGISKSFNTINDYLEFYASAIKLDKVIMNLPRQLLIKGRYEDFKGMFLKTLYYQLAKALIKSEPLFKSFSNDSFNNDASKFLEYNRQRIDIIKTVIKVNIRNHLKQNNLPLRNNETPLLNELKESTIKILSLREILSLFPFTINSLFPILLVKNDQVPFLFGQGNYQFDASLIFIDDDMSTLEGALTSAKCDQIITFDNRLLRDEYDDMLKARNNELFINACLKCYVKANYLAATYKVQILKANTYDIPFKKYLFDKLKKENFIVFNNYQTHEGTIDLVVKTDAISRPTAIIVDHLKYDSLEAAINSLAAMEHILTNQMNFAYYHIVPLFFFMDEEKEFEKLKSFIIKHTIIKRNKKTKKVTKPLVDVLFQDYILPEEVYYTIKNKDSKLKEDIFKEFLEKTAPISVDECKEIFKDDYLPIVSSLESEKVIQIRHNFVFLNNEKITFKKVSKSLDIIRNLDYVSNEEIAEGIIAISYVKTLSEDEIIKLILISLGYSKMNHNQYFRLHNIIGGLIEDKLLLVQDGKITHS